MLFYALKSGLLASFGKSCPVLDKWGSIFSIKAVIPHRIWRYSLVYTHTNKRNRILSECILNCSDYVHWVWRSSVFYGRMLRKPLVDSGPSLC